MMRLVSAQITFMLIPACVNGFIATLAGAALRRSTTLCKATMLSGTPQMSMWPQPVCGALPWALSSNCLYFAPLAAVLERSRKAPWATSIPCQQRSRC